MKIVVFRYDAGIVTTLSISYDDCRYPRRSAPLADRSLKIQKKLPARCASERPSGKGDPLVDDFHGTGVI